MRFWFVTAVLVLSLLGTLHGQETYRQGYDAGFAEGLSAGQEDQEARHPFDFANKPVYQEASEGFDPTVHVRDVYTVAFRRGYEDGYEEGYGLVEGKPITSDAVDSTSLRQSSATFEIPRGTQLRVKLLDTLTTRRNEEGDLFRVEVVENVRVGDRIAVPEGSRITGRISYLRRPGRIRGKAEMTLIFEELQLPSQQRVPLKASVASIEERSRSQIKDEEGTVEGPGSKRKDATRVGAGAGVGALIGVLTGGGSGAKSGAASGAIVGLAGVLVTRGDDMVLYSETELEIELEEKLVLPASDNP